MEIRGRDPATECYRVDLTVDGRTVTALVPERLAADLRLIGARPSHQEAYVWMAEYKDRIEAAITQLARGGTRPKAPFDQIILSEDR
jgi:molybdenum cofactor biosynthesis enzyme MoaA